MSVSPVGTAGAGYAPLAQSTAEPAQAAQPVGEVKHDGDGDDGAGGGTKALPPSATLGGQTIGTTVSVKA